MGSWVYIPSSWELLPNLLGAGGGGAASFVEGGSALLAELLAAAAPSGGDRETDMLSVW
jgi:hypothetical protein